MTRSAYVDPGSKTGLAIYLGGPTPIVALLDRPSPALIRNQLITARNLGVTRVVIEDQHPPRIHTAEQRKRFSWESQKTMIRTAWTWAAIATLEGLETDLVMPSTWQGPSFATVDRLDDDGKKLSTKARCKLKVAATWETVPRFYPQGKNPTGPSEAKLTAVARLNEHIRDAAVMGRWDQLHGGGR